jgi:hypothetical protein
MRAETRSARNGNGELQIRPTDLDWATFDAQTMQPLQGRRGEDAERHGGDEDCKG